MKRLIEKGLMFGNLIHVSSPALVDRYNRALDHLTGKTTGLSDFHIDISGYSPEVGDELDDHLYLNPNGVNRQFILLTTEQKTAPLLGAKFSTSRGILRDFIEANEPQLFALTAHDAVAGELANSVYELSSPARLFDIRRIVVEADTTRAHVKNAEELAGLITRFRDEEDGWWDDVLIAEMIGLARETGDVTRNPVALTGTVAEQGNFWTEHFGGLYVFRDVEHPAAITTGARADLGDLPLRYVFELKDRDYIARFLELNHLAEPIVRAKGADGAAILRQKMDFILVEAGATLGHDLGHVTRRDLRQLAQRLGDALPDAFKGLAEMLRWAEGGGGWPHINSRHPAYFYTLRATAGPNRDLVNQLLAELAPLDVRQLFICHKALFYRLYATWPEAKKAFVADFLEREYQVDKAGARKALFGSEPAMGDAPPPDEDLIDLVGPWGAVRKGR